ncbi:MAG: hemolysin family protein [Gemmatimonadales bacterium]
MSEITLTSLLLRVGAVVFLLAVNAFFVAAEFALVAARRTRIDAMAAEGDERAKTVQKALTNLNLQLSSTQLGITISSILLGYVAEETVAVFLHDWFAALPPPFAFLGRAAIISVIAISVITFLHVVIGEIAPKTWAITYPERVSRRIAGPLMLFTWLTLPLINLLNWCSIKLLRLFGLKADIGHDRPHSPEEIVMIVRQAQQVGHFDKQDVDMIEGVMEFTEKRARDVMTPRTDVVDLTADMTIGEAATKVVEVGRSRYPITGASLDDIVGVVHVKQILRALPNRSHDTIASIGREPMFVPGSREVEDVLADMKRTKAHLVVVLDEFGGTAGIVTMEDLIEEIIGEIFDEHDPTEPVPQAGADGVIFPGEMEIEDINTQYDLHLDVTDYQTIGGFVFGRLGRLPRVGDAIVADERRFEVTAMEGHRVGTVTMSEEASS